MCAADFNRCIAARDGQDIVTEMPPHLCGEIPDRFFVLHHQNCLAAALAGQVELAGGVRQRLAHLREIELEGRSPAAPYTQMWPPLCLTIP